MTWKAAMLAAFVAVLGHGRWWVVALAAFLVRGGLLLLLPTVVILPTPAELAAALVDPRITGIGLAGLGPDAPGLLLAAAAVVAALVATGGLIGAWLEAELVARVAADEELAAVGPLASVAVRPPLGAAFSVRLLAHIPTILAVAVGLVVLAAVTYAELLAPSGRASLAVRVVLRAPIVVAALAGIWLVGEAWGGLAVRHLAGGASVRRALLDGLLALGRPSGFLTLVVTSLVVATPIAALWLAAGEAFGRLWPLVVDRADPVLVVAALGLFAGTWVAGLWLLALALAWRSAAWTAEAFRG